jgi:hypothetical protein
MRIFLFLLAFVLINTVAAEFLINRSSNTWLTLLFGAILITSIYFLIYKPLKRIL